MSTKLAFRTLGGPLFIPAGHSKELGVVDVSPFSKIRVVAVYEHGGSGAGVNIRLAMKEEDELVAQLDVLSLAPHSEVTKVYEVPGTRLAIFADAIGGKGADGVDVLIYGA